MPLAIAGTQISVARMLWAFNIQKGLDANGNEIPVDVFDYTNGLNFRPSPFKARFTPRSEAIKQTIIREAELALEELEKYNIDTKVQMSKMDFGKRVETL